MRRTIEVLGLAVCLSVVARGQLQRPSPSVSQVLMYSAVQPSLTVTPSGGQPIVFNQPLANVYTYNGAPVAPSDKSISLGENYSASKSFAQLNSALSASIATALSIIPLSSPASGVIFMKDPQTGAELPGSSTLGPIFTERAETIGKRHFYIGFSNQDFHFTKFNGASLNSLSLLYPGDEPSNVLAPHATTVPATFSLGMDVRLSQSIAFLTYGVTDSFDVSLGLPLVHAAMAAHTYNGMVYAGNGTTTNGSTCWCVNTFTPGVATLEEPQIGQSSLGKTGIGDVLLRVKGTVFRRPNVVVAIGGDVRLPTGDANNYLGVGTTTLKPFAAVSFYSKPLAKGIVLSPHFDVGWQFGGKSILGGLLSGTNNPISAAPGSIITAPFTATRDYLPDVLAWATGAEVAVGRRNTLVVDILGNQVGLIHGIRGAKTQSKAALSPTGPTPDGSLVPTPVIAAGLVSAGRVSFGQYSASVGYKARIAGNLVANLSYLLRLDNNGLVARGTPLFGLGYSF